MNAIVLPTAYVENPRPRAAIIYGLRLRGTDEFRYVGQTAQHLEQRLYQHAWAAQKRPTAPVAQWIAEVGAENIEAEILAATHVLERSAADELEMRFIRHYTDAGPRLVNETKGGPGRATEEHAPPPPRKARGAVADGTRERLRLAALERAQVRTPEELQAIRDSLVAAWLARSPAQRLAAVNKRLSTIADRASQLSPVEREGLRRARSERAKAARAAMDGLSKAAAARKVSESHAARTPEQREATRAKRAATRAARTQAARGDSPERCATACRLGISVFTAHQQHAHRHAHEHPHPTSLYHRAGVAIWSDHLIEHSTPCLSGSRLAGVQYLAITGYAAVVGYNRPVWLAFGFAAWALLGRCDVPAPG